jgi:hypothetical protein
MSTSLHICTALGLALGFAAGTLATSDESDEPALRFELESELGTLAVAPGESFELDLGDRQLRMTLEVQPTRLLELEPLRFEYPNGYSFEYEQDDETTFWTLDGNDVVIMLQRYWIEMDGDEFLELFVDELITGYDGEDGGAVPLELDGEVLEGRAVGIDSMGFTMQQECFVFTTADGDLWLLVLQDTLEDDGAHTDEYEAARVLLEETFQYTD